MLLLWLIACSQPVLKGPEGQVQDTSSPDTSSPDTSSPDTSSPDSSQDTAPPCTPLGAMFFDLGETLVVEGAGDTFDTRDGALDLLDALAAAGIPRGVITTVPRGYDLDDLAALLTDPEILESFDVVLLSSQAESRPKPDPAIYAEALALLPSPPPIALAAFLTEELGDLADADPPTEGAMAAGMIGVHLSDGAPSPLVDHTVATDALAGVADAPWVACVEAE